MAMSDDLTTRCLAEVERAMADYHTNDCGLPADVLLPPGPCDCNPKARLASRLARMLEVALRYGGLGWENGLQEVIKAREVR